MNLSLLLIQGVAALIATGAASIAQTYPADKKTRSLSAGLEKLGWAITGVTCGSILEAVLQLLSRQ